MELTIIGILLPAGVLFVICIIPLTQYMFLPGAGDITHGIGTPGGHCSGIPIITGVFILITITIMAGITDLITSVLLPHMLITDKEDQHLPL